MTATTERGSLLLTLIMRKSEDGSSASATLYSGTQTLGTVSFNFTSGTSSLKWDHGYRHSQRFWLAGSGTGYGIPESAGAGGPDGSPPPESLKTLSCQQLKAFLPARSSLAGDFFNVSVDEGGPSR